MLRCLPPRLNHPEHLLWGQQGSNELRQPSSQASIRRIVVDSAPKMRGAMGGKKVAQIARLGSDFTDEAFFCDELSHEFRVPRPRCRIIPE